MSTDGETPARQRASRLTVPATELEPKSMYPDLIFAGHRTDAADLKRQCWQLAGALERMGVGDGDIVALMLHNSPAFVQTALACRDLGAFYCPINWHFKAQEAEHLLTDTAASVLLIEPDLLALIGNVVPASTKVIIVDHHWDSWLAQQKPWVGVTEPRAARGFIPYTSGTTGKPKGVRRVMPSAQEAPNMAARALALYRQVLGLKPGVKTLVSAPLYHSAPATYMLQCALNETTMYLEARFDAQRTVELIANEQITHSYMVPTMFHRLLDVPAKQLARYDTSSLTFVTCTGSPCPSELKSRFHATFGPVIHESYASSETGYITCINPEEARLKPGSVGRPVGEATVKILDDENRELPTGERGKIYVRQPGTPDFDYQNRHEERVAIETDGLVCIGDVGYFDADGYLYLSDRKSDMVISGGVNIYPAEIEATLSMMPQIKDCAVFGIPHPEFGEALACAVQLQPNTHLDASELQSYVRERMAGYKVPREVVFHQELPREDTGKIFKRKLREPYWAAETRKI